MAIVYNKYTFQ